MSYSDYGRILRDGVVSLVIGALLVGAILGALALKLAPVVWRMVEAAWNAI